MRARDMETNGNVTCTFTSNQAFCLLGLVNLKRTLWKALLVSWQKCMRIEDVRVMNKKYFLTNIRAIYMKTLVSKHVKLNTKIKHFIDLPRFVRKAEIGIHRAQDGWNMKDWEILTANKCISYINKSRFKFKLITSRTKMTLYQCTS